MTAHVYNAIIIANDLNIMVSLNYSIVSWLMRAIGNRFQFAVSCTAFALLVRFFVVVVFQLEVCLHIAWNLKWASNRIRYTAQITMKIYELFSQCEFISWPMCARMPAKRWCRRSTAVRTLAIAPNPIESSTISWNRNGNYFCFVHKIHAIFIENEMNARNEHVNALTARKFMRIEITQRNASIEVHSRK